MYKYFIMFFVVASITAQEIDTLKQDSIAVNKEILPTISPAIPKSACDPWFSQDKLLHFSTCAALSGLTYHIYVCRLKKDEKLGKVYSVSITALIGFGKEIYDKKKKRYFSWKDLFWDGVGLAVGYFAFIHEY